MNGITKPERLYNASLKVCSAIAHLEAVRRGILRKGIEDALDRLIVEFNASHPPGIDKESWDRYGENHSPIELLELFVKLRSDEISAVDFTREITQNLSPRILPHLKHLPVLPVQTNIT